MDVTLVGILHQPMASLNPMTLKFSLLLIIILAFKSYEKEIFAFETRENIVLCPKVKVIIINGLDAPVTPKRLTVHCKSKDDDLGFHTLEYGQSYDFSFRPLVFPKWEATLFFCSFTWPTNTQLHYLDVYNQRKDKCITCPWKISSKDGCKYNSDFKDFDICTPFKSMKLIDANSTSKI